MPISIFQFIPLPTPLPPGNHKFVFYRHEGTLDGMVGEGFLRK